MTDPQRVIDRFEGAVESQRLRSTFIDDLAEEPFTQFAMWAESLTTVAEAIDTTNDALGEWSDAEDREDKAEARERAFEALEQLVSAWNTSPLDLSKLKTWTPEMETP